jgi:hypothetical protein
MPQLHAGFLSGLPAIMSGFLELTDLAGGHARRLASGSPGVRAS